MVCSSMAALSAAAQSGFAVTVAPQSQVSNGLTTVKPEYGLPVLPDVEFMLFERPVSSRPALAELADTIVEKIADRRNNA